LKREREKGKGSSFRRGKKANNNRRKGRAVTTDPEKKEGRRKRDSGKPVQKGLEKVQGRAPTTEKR